MDKVQLPTETGSATIYLPFQFRQEVYPICLEGGRWVAWHVPARVDSYVLCGLMNMHVCWGAWKFLVSNLFALQGEAIAEAERRNAKLSGEVKADEH